jgi:hypothetical protein
MRHDTTQAVRYYAEALAFIEDREITRSLPFVLSGVACLAVAVGRPRDGARLLGAARLQEYGAVSDSRIRMRNHVLARIEQALSVDACTFEMSLGNEFSLSDAVRLARSV